MEYDNNNKGSLWLADKLTKNEEQYYTGNITIDNKEHKISMFVNTSENPKAPKFKLTVNTFVKQDIQESPKQESDPYKDFANENKDETELSDLDLPF